MGEFLLQEGIEVSVPDKIAIVREQMRRARAESLPDKFSRPSEWLDKSVPHPEYEAEGLRLLGENKMAVLMVAGGLSTRLGPPGLRGNLSIGPVTDRTLFRLQGEKIAALKERYAPELLWLVLTSPQVHEDTVTTFEREAFFGVPEQSVCFFQQQSFPVLDANGDPVTLPDGSYLEVPGGHGGMFGALRASGLLARLHDTGIEHLLYFQYPNVLEQIFDPVMLGYHHLRNHDATVKAIMQYTPNETLGKCAVVNDRVVILEYHFLEGLDSQDPLWHQFPASAGTLIWRVAFLKRSADMGIELPFHVLPHRLSPESPAIGFKIEQFVFDLMPHTRQNGIVVAQRAEAFAPLKTKEGPYSLETCRAALARLYYQWLIEAGATPSEDIQGECVVEISPRFALNAAELKSRISDGLVFESRMVLRP